jgi:hypothetical protein
MQVLRDPATSLSVETMLKPKLLKVYVIPPKMLKGKVSPMAAQQLLSMIANIYEEKAKADR